MGFIAAAGSVLGDHYDANYDACPLDPERSLGVEADGTGDGPGGAFASGTSVDRFAAAIREAAAPHSPAAP